MFVQSGVLRYKTRNVGGHPQLVDPLVQTSNHCVYTMGWTGHGDSVRAAAVLFAN